MLIQFFKNLKQYVVFYSKTTTSCCFIAISFSFLMIASCNNKSNNTGSNKDTAITRTDSTQHEGMQTTTAAEGGMTMIHKGMDMAKAGKEMMEKGTSAKDKDMMERGMKMMDEGMNMISMGKGMMEKDGNAMADQGMKDNMDMMDKGMDMMNMGKNMADSTMKNMESDVGGMNMNKSMDMNMNKSMDMMDKGMNMMNKAASGMGGGGMKKDKPMNDM